MNQSDVIFKCFEIETNKCCVLRRHIVYKVQSQSASCFYLSSCYDLYFKTWGTPPFAIICGRKQYFFYTCVLVLLTLHVCTLLTNSSCKLMFSAYPIDSLLSRRRSSLYLLNNGIRCFFRLCMY